VSLSIRSNRNPSPRLDSGVSTPLPIPRFENRGNPLSGFDSLSEFHPYITASNRDPILESRLNAPSEVSSPSTYLSREEPLNPGSSQLAGWVAPSGFLTPSTLCSPHGLPGLFHPGSAHGVWPSEAFLLTWRRTLFRDAAPLRVSPLPINEEAALSGTLTPNEAPTTDPGTSQMTAPTASLGFPAPRLAAFNREERSRALSSPLALSRFGRTLTKPLAPQGLTCWKRGPLSLEMGQPPCSFSPRDSSRRFEDPAGLGLWVSLRGRPASPRAPPPLCPAVRSSAGACREA